MSNIWGSTIKQGDSTNRSVRVDDDGCLVTFQGVDTANVTSVATSTTVFALKAANTSRKDLVIYNDSNSNLYYKFGSDCTPTDFTDKIPAGGCRWLAPVTYTGIVTGILDAGTGNAQITELT